MKHLTYEQLMFKLNHDEMVMIKDDGKYTLFGGAGKDVAGDYRMSGWWTNKENCFNNIGSYSGNLKSYLETNIPNWEYIDSYPPKQTPVPVGTKVRILENAQEECEKFKVGWSSVMDNMIGKVYEVRNYNGSIYLINNYNFPRSAFVIADEVEEEMTVEQICKELGRNIKIIK